MYVRLPLIAVSLNEVLAVSPNRTPDILEVDEALARLAQVEERKARIIELHVFGGMSREEIAAACGLTIATVKRDLRLGYALLRLEMSRHS
jgi:DNA-directed RNA polymerase specialized sigma24 family protein